MGLFDLFKKKPKFKDEVFGELDFTTFRDRNKNFYEGRVSFDSQIIGIIIDADANGPTKAQKDFFAELQITYESLKNDSIFPHLKKELIDWFDGAPITEFDTLFSIDGIALPRITNTAVEWSLTLYCIPIAHYVTISFVNFEPQEGVIVDG